MNSAIDPKQPYGAPVKVIFGLCFVLLAIYLGAGLLQGDLQYGACGGRMSKNCNAVHLTSPLGLAIGTLHLGSLLFALGCLALRPVFFLRRRVVIPTVLVFVSTHLLLIAFELA